MCFVIEDVVGYNVFGIQNDIVMLHRLTLYVVIFKAQHISVNLFLKFFYYFVLKKIIFLFVLGFLISFFARFC
jgi:hypothetical protein